MRAKNTPTNITLDLTALNDLLTKKGKVTVTELAAFYKTGKRALRAELKTLKEKGLVRSEGKEYVVKDGDVILFRFNV